jgi:VanZ family protein
MIKLLEKHNILSWLITIIIAAFIFYMSTINLKGPPGGYGWKTIVYHFTVFLIFTFFLLISIIKGSFKNKKLIILAIIIAVLYAISDEVHQIFVPGRYFSIVDILTNFSGVFLASFIYLMRKK